MTDYTVHLTDVLNQNLAVDGSYMPAADEKIPKAWGKEGALDHLDEHGLSVQRTAYIQGITGGKVGLIRTGGDGDTAPETQQTPNGTPPYNYPGLDIA